MTSGQGSASWMVITNRILTIMALWIIYLLLRQIRIKEIEQEKINKQLDQRVAIRTQEVLKRNKELEQLTYISSHDLQEPIRIIISYVDIIKSSNGDKLDEIGLKSLDLLMIHPNDLSF